MHKKERRSTKIFCRPGKNARAQWLVFNGRYGVPPLFAIMPQGIDEATRQKYMDFARRCISNAAGVLPAGSDVKAVNPGATGPDTFSRLIDLSTQEMVLRATCGLMTMLTAPGAGTNTETGSAHQDAFDDLAAAEAEEIAAVASKADPIKISAQDLAETVLNGAHTTGIFRTGTRTEEKASSLSGGIDFTG